MYKNCLVVNLFFFVLFTISSENQLHAKETKIQKAMIQDLEVIRHNLSLKYAPTDWKQEYNGWNIDDAFEKAKSKIFKDNPTTVHEYQTIVKEFLNASQDYHLKTIFYSTEKSFFPFQIKGINNHYYLLGIGYPADYDEGFASDELDLESLVDLKKMGFGDELISLDGVPITTIIEQLIDDNLGGDRSPTGYVLAERMLFYRQGKYGQQVLSGNIKLKMKRISSSAEYECTIPWMHTPEWVENPDNMSSLADSILENLYPIKDEKMKGLEFFSKDYRVNFVTDLMVYKKFNFAKGPSKDVKNEEKAITDIKDEREIGFLPPLGKIIWESDKNNLLYAYIYQNKLGKSIGYIYLSSFLPTKKSYELVVEELIDILLKFNKNTEALVFDITDNGGGDPFFMYAVLSTLTDHPLKTHLQQELLIQEDVLNASHFQKSFKKDKFDEVNVCGFPITPEIVTQIHAYTEKVRQVWKSGERMTPLMHIYGIKEIPPSLKVQYLKPLVVLTNELDFSCADLFPAILQDNGRGKIFGAKTAGAGGHVRLCKHNSRFGLMGYSMTGSIVYRLDGKTIENLGVTPDIPYKVTLKDIQRNYVDYIRTLNGEINKLLK
ncbi:MAG: protease-like activity factor CPAF [Parachlamydiaceae bacterium]|nr:protease-like activity factor CPAF [Parachlamydiaceae bacterium]